MQWGLRCLFLSSLSFFWCWSKSGFQNKVPYFRDYKYIQITNHKYHLVAVGHFKTISKFPVCDFTSLKLNLMTEVLYTKFNDRNFPRLWFSILLVICQCHTVFISDFIYTSFCAAWSTVEGAWRQRIRSLCRFC
jgi:hypothetical protein